MPKKLKGYPFLLPAAIILAVIAVIVVALVLGADSSTKVKVSSTAQTKSCGNYRDDRNVIIDGQTIHAEIPNDPAALQKGLAGRPCILSDQGMLFIFPKEGNYPFWMKGMKFPIDIVWITSQKTVAAIEIDEKPSSYPDRFVNRIPAQYVLELKANRSKELHMKIGSPVTL